MGIFDKLFKKKTIQPYEVDGYTVLEEHNNGLLETNAFLGKFGGAKVYYSTPVGDHKDGEARLFALPGKEDQVYYPVFSSREKADEYFEKSGRVAYMLIEGYCIDFIKTIISMNKDSEKLKYGVIIDYKYYDLTLEPGMLEGTLQVMELYRTLKTL